MFIILTGREPPFEEALDWLQFLYTVYRAGAYVSPASTVLAQSAGEEVVELFPAILAHLRRRNPEVYGPAVATGWAPELKDLQIREGGGLSGGISVHSSIKLGAYAGRFINLSLAGINIPIPNLTTVYLNTPLVGPTLEPLEYVPFPDRICQPIGYPPISTGGGPSTGVSKRNPPFSPPTSQYSTRDECTDWLGATLQSDATSNRHQQKLSKFSKKGGTSENISAAGFG